MNIQTRDGFMRMYKVMVSSEPGDVGVSFLSFHCIPFSIVRISPFLKFFLKDWIKILEGRQSTMSGPL